MRHGFIFSTFDQRAVAADAAAAAVAVDRAGGLARGLRRSRPVSGVIAPPPARPGAYGCSSRATLACMCLFGYVVFAWGLLRRSLLQGFSSPGPPYESSSRRFPFVGFQFSKL